MRNKITKLKKSKVPKTVEPIRDTNNGQPAIKLKNNFAIQNAPIAQTSNKKMGCQTRIANLKNKRLLKPISITSVDINVAQAAPFIP